MSSSEHVDAAFGRVSGGLAATVAAAPIVPAWSSDAAVLPMAPGRAASTRRRRIITAAALVIDAVAIAFGALVAGPAPVPGVAAIPLALVAFALVGLYDRRQLVAPSEEARRVLHGAAAAAAGLLVIAFALDIEVGRTWLATAFVAALTTVGVTRYAARKTIHELAGRGVVGQRVLVIGTNDEARSLSRTLARRRWLGYQAAGFVDAGSGSFGSIDGMPVVGTVDDIEVALRTVDASAVLIAGSAVNAAELPALYARLQSLDVEVRVSAGLPHVAASRVSVDPLDGVAILSVRPFRLSQAQAAIKRTIDICASLFLLIAAAPVMAAVAVAVRLTSAGPALFRQTRVGANGKAFTIYKFRTMVVDAEERKAALADQNEADGLLFKMEHDPRVTTVGRHFRTWGLDELPQLFNVLRGDMSLVGPRPPVPEEVARYDEVLKNRLRVKPGITGLWQVNGRHELSFADYLRYDLFYVENWSIGMDLYVIARTLPALLARRGAA